MGCLYKVYGGISGSEADCEEDGGEGDVQGFTEGEFLATAISTSV